MLYEVITIINTFNQAVQQFVVGRPAVPGFKIVIRHTIHPLNHIVCQHDIEAQELQNSSTNSYRICYIDRYFRTTYQFGHLSRIVITSYSIHYTKLYEVERIDDKTFIRAKNQLEKYETSGWIRVPLVAIHTIGDHVTPYWHATDYELKIQDEGNDYWFTGMPVPAYGHCTIEKTDIMAALAILVAKTASQNDFKIAEAAFKSDDQRNAFEQILSGNAITVDFK